MAEPGDDTRIAKAILAAGALRALTSFGNIDLQLPGSRQRVVRIAATIAQELFQELFAHDPKPVKI